METHIKSKSETIEFRWVAAAFMLFLVMGLLVYASPRSDRSVAVIASPFIKDLSAAAVVVRAGGVFEDSAVRGRVIIAQSDNPRFISALYASGAFFVFNPRLLAGCRPLKD
ncbi:MAG: hypothetical protein B7Z26_06615 [Asticcacaulis sp. 32-58-5]|nr:MAG: hypothetical protein B7Z26_06615 [Asticcacaulis sp. 32-58-5]